MPSQTPRNERDRFSVGERLIPIGKVVGCHGIRGEIRLRLYNPESKVLAEAAEVFLLAPEGEPPPTRVRGARPHGGLWLLFLEDVSTRDAAKALSGIEVAIRQKDLEPLGTGEYYHYQLIGLEVVDESGRSLGSVREVMPTGGSDVLAVNDRGHERLIPMIADVIRTVDLAARRIVIRPLAGLFDF